MRILLVLLCLSAAVSALPVGKATLSAEAKKDKQGGGYTIKLVHPDFPGHPVLNRLAAGPFQADKARFLQQYREDGTLGSGRAWSLEGEATVVFQTEKLAVIDYECSQDSGGAHPGPISHALILDLAKEQKIPLSSFFAPKSDYLRVLSRYCIDQLKNNKDLDQLQQGAAPKAENFHQTYPVKDGINVTFVVYQVGPYVVGPQTVLVPWSQLDKVLNRKFLTRMGIKA